MFYVTGMDWDFSIERNREGLLGAIMGLFALIGLVEGSVIDRLSRPLYRKVLGQVRSAEAAVRRLIIVMARDIVVEPRPKRPRPAGLIRSRKGTFQGKSSSQSGSGQSKSRPPSFPLCDPQKRSDAGQASSPAAEIQWPRAPHPCLGSRSADSGVPSRIDPSTRTRSAAG